MTPFVPALAPLARLKVGCESRLAGAPVYIELEIRNYFAQQQLLKEISFGQRLSSMAHHAPGGYSLRAQPPGGMSQIGSMLKDNARPQPMDRADRKAWERPRGAPQGQGQPPGGRSSFAFDDYAGQEDDYLGRAVPRQHRKHFPEPGANPPGGHSNFAFDDGVSARQNPMAALQSPGRRARAPDEYSQPPGGRATFGFNEAPPAPVPHHPNLQNHHRLTTGRSTGLSAAGRPRVDESSQPQYNQPQYSQQQYRPSSRALPDHGADALSEFVAARQGQGQGHGQENRRENTSAQSGRGGGVFGGAPAQFSVNWGMDDHCNQHHHYSSNAKPPPAASASYRHQPPPPLQLAAMAAPAPVPSYAAQQVGGRPHQQQQVQQQVLQQQAQQQQVGGRPHVGLQYQQQYQQQQQQQQQGGQGGGGGGGGYGGGGHGGGGGGGIGGQRLSTRVLAPPGGASTICFG